MFNNKKVSLEKKVCKGGKIKVYALSCAGGNSMLFNGIVRHNNDNVEIVPIELSGHGRRMGETFYNDFQEALDDVYSKICNDVKNDKYAIMGYSMGGVLAYEVCCMIDRNGRKLPDHMFIASMRTPESVSVFNRVGGILNDEELLQFVVDLGGIPEALIDNSAFYKVFFPIIKSDFLLLNRYKVSEIRKFDTGITVLYGDEDNYVKEYIQGWSQYTNKYFDVIPYKGGHFFINDHSTQIFLDICERLLY